MGIEMKQFCDFEKAVDYLQISPSTMRKYMRDGIIKFTKSRSGKIYFEKQELENFIMNKN